jgi:photosystem II stability/assembly factor-like uncharacterized protein
MKFRETVTLAHTCPPKTLPKTTTRGETSLISRQRLSAGLKKAGIFNSDDRGDSWTRATTDIAPEDDFAFLRLYASKANPKRIYAAAGLNPNDQHTDYGSLSTVTDHDVTKLQGGIYRSEDDGQTWNRVNTSFTEASVRDRVRLRR